MQWGNWQTAGVALHSKQAGSNCCSMLVSFSSRAALVDSQGSTPGRTWPWCTAGGTLPESLHTLHQQREGVETLSCKAVCCDWSLFLLTHFPSFAQQAVCEFPCLSVCACSQLAWTYVVESKASAVQKLPCLIRTGNGVMKLMQSCLSHGCLKFSRVLLYVR